MLTKQMQEHQLFSKYTIPSLLDELDFIEMIHIPGKTPLVREVLNKQVQLYKDMGVESPVGILS